ncbi:MAG: hypothetical protein F4057_03120, partial [Acidobacteria bacterium]|nr:hypothetical protein [Acidobacteriota bacterium]
MPISSRFGRVTVLWAGAVAALTLGVGVVAGAGGQGPAERPAPPPPQGPTPEDVGRISPAVDTPTFRSGVTLVTTDVIARESTGPFLPDLT